MFHQPLSTLPRLLLTLALLLPTILPALADGVNRPPAASTSASTFTSPLPPPTPAPLPAARLALTLDVDPAWAAPGDVVTFTVTAANPGDAPLANLVLTDTLPDGLVYVAQSGVGFAYVARKKQLTWQTPALAAGTAITGSFQARMQGLALGDTVTNTVTASAAGLAVPIHANATVDVVSPRNDEAWATPGYGGLLRSTDDRVLLRVPAGAVAGRTRFRYAAISDAPNPPENLQAAFRLEAQDAAGQGVPQTRLGLSLIFRSPTAQPPATILYEYDPTAQQWLQVPASVDRPQRQLKATVHHLALMAVATASEESHLKGFWAPAVVGLQASLFTGDSTFSYPLELPAAPGGATPALALSYSSAAANAELQRSLNDRTGQASPYGLGWSLTGAGAVTRDQDGHHFLEFPGGSYRLEQNAGQWYTIPRSFLQISHDDSERQIAAEPIYLTQACGNGPQVGYADIRAAGTAPWAIRTPDGTRYLFGAAIDARGVPSNFGATAYHWVGPGATSCNCSTSAGTLCGAVRMRPYRWNLTRVEPASGPAWTLTYDYSLARLRNFSDGYNVQTKVLCETINNNAPEDWRKGHVTDSRLTAIEYGNGHYRVRFGYVNLAPYGHRSDVPTWFDWRKTDPNWGDWDDFGYGCEDQWIVSDYLAVTDGTAGAGDMIVESRADPNQAWNPPADVIRRYDLGQAYFHHLALTSIALKDDQGNELPTARLTVTNQRKVDNSSNNAEAIVQVENGLGGQVALTYERKTCGSAALSCDNGAPQNGRLAVTRRTVKTAPAAAQSVQDYQYLGGAYAQPAGSWQFWGFATVTDTLSTPGTAPQQLRRTETRFNVTDEQLKGKRIQETTWDQPTGAELARVTETWSSSEGFPRLDETAEYQNGVPLAKRKYYYDPYYQDRCGAAAQYGNATRIEEYDATNATPTRTTLTGYCPNTTVWIVNKPAFSNVYTGSVSAPPTLPDISQLAASTWFIYSDDQQNPSPAWNQVVGSKGQLRGVRRVLSADASGAQQLGDTRYRHDAFGNLTEEQAFTSYGTATAWASAAGPKVTTSYDTTFGVFALTKTATPGPGGGAALTTSYQYYGLNGEASGQGLFGQLQSVTDPNGAVTRYRYDDWGRVTEVRRPVVDPASYTPPCSGFTCAATEVYGYVDMPPFTIYHAVRKDAQPDSVATASYRQDWTFYDGQGQVIQTQAEGATPAQGVLVSQSYNALGLVVSQTVPYFGTATGVYQPLSAWAGKTTATLYDALGRVTKVLAPDNAATNTYYDGRQTAVVDALNHQTLREVDAFGRLISVKQYTNVATPPSWTAPVAFQASYAYNVRDQLEQVTGSDGAVSDPAYDLLGRKTGLTDADMGAWQYRYDAAGNLVKQRDARNQAICFYYDGHNRLVGKTYHANTPDLDSLTCPNTGFVVSYGYDAGANGLGRRTSLTDASGATSWSYDARGRVANETKTIGTNTFVTGHSYRSDDRPATLTYPDGEVLTYGYDAAGRLTALSGAPASEGGAPAATYLTAATYTALGQPLSRSYGNGATLSYGYHPTSYRLTSLTAPGVNLGYTYQNNGNVASLSDGGATTTFTYDDLDRLKTASGGYNASYSYQPNGNLTTKTEGGVTVNLTYPAGKHAPGSVNGQTYTYTVTGNLTARPGQTFSYDAENRLTQIVSGTITTTFTYDGDGNLVKKVAVEGTTLYVGPHYEVQPLPASPPPLPPPSLPPTLTKRSFLPFVANNALFVDGQPAQLVKYYLVGDQRIASRIGSAGPVTYYYHDHLGSTIASSGATGGGSESTRYWPYGATRSGSLGTAYRFTGQRQDMAGLYFYQSRWYDAQLGRFLQPDTIVPELGDPQSLNRYTYAKNSPLIYNDPTGHIAWFVPLITGAVGAGTGFIGSLAGQMLATDGSFQDRLNSVNWKSAGVAAGVGFVAGAAAPFTAATALGAVVTSAVAGGTQYVLTQKVNNEGVNPTDMAVSVGLGAGAGIIAGPVLTSARASVYATTSRWLNSQVTRSIIDEGVVETAVKVPSVARSTIAGLTSNAPTAPITKAAVSGWGHLIKSGDAESSLRVYDHQPVGGRIRHGGHQAE